MNDVTIDRDFFVLLCVAATGLLWLVGWVGFRMGVEKAEDQCEKYGIVTPSLWLPRSDVSVINVDDEKQFAEVEVCQTDILDHLRETKGKQSLVLEFDLKETMKLPLPPSYVHDRYHSIKSRSLNPPKVGDRVQLSLVEEEEARNADQD